MNRVIIWIILTVSLISLLSTIGAMILNSVFNSWLLLGITYDILILTHSIDALKHKCNLK